MKKKLLIFDVDGTIWDSQRDIYKAFNYALNKIANCEIDKSEFQNLLGMALQKQYEIVLPPEKKQLCEDCAKLYRNYYIDEEHYLDDTILYDNVKETLDCLKKTGFYMAVASNKAQRVLDKMLKHFELDMFDCVCGTGEGNFNSKPNPEIINYIVEKLKVAKSEAVIIGDSKSDILCGKNAKIDSILVTYGYGRTQDLVKLNPDCVIDRFEELKDVVNIEK